MGAAVTDQPEWSIDAVVDWLFREGRLIDDPGEFVLQLARRLYRDGAPIERLLITMLTLNPEIVASSNVWLASTDSIEHFDQCI